MLQIKALKSYLLIRGLFNDSVSSSDNWPLASNNRMINELERIWQKEVVN
jgi:hypothetical protein